MATKSRDDTADLRAAVIEAGCEAARSASDRMGYGDAAGRAEAAPLLMAAIAAYQAVAKVTP